MAMGSTGTINISPEMITNAKQAIDDYRTKTSTLANNLKSTVDGIIPAHFSGSAATGFQNFYNNRIDPLIVTNLTNLLKAIDDICDGIMNAIPANEGVDEKLAEENNKQGGTVTTQGGN